MSKLHWKTVTLGDVADNSTAATKDPFGDGYTRYVIGKHIPTNSSKITTWNEVGDGEFGSRIRTMFRAGDIICTTRGPNLRVAVPDFDGLCAHTNFILRTKDTSFLLQKYLEYVISSDGFQNYLKLNFRGSTNLFVNWSDAAKYKFPLPPLDEQRRIADLLWAADDVISNYQDLLEKQYELQFVLMLDLLSAKHWSTKGKSTRFGQIPEHWEMRKISEIAKVDYGISEAVADNLDPSIGWKILTGANVTLDGTIDLFKINYIKPPTKEGFILKYGDILLNWRSGSPEHVGKAAIFDLEGNYTYASFLLKIRVGESMNNLFLHRLLNFMRKNKLFGASTSQQVNFKMNAAVFRDTEVLVPTMKEQLEIVEIFENWKNTTHALISHIESSKKLKQIILSKHLA